MNDAEFEDFAEAMEGLENQMCNVDLGAQEENESNKKKYQSMRRTIEDSMDDLNDHRRLTSEEADLEKEIKKLQDEISRYNATLKDHNETKDEAQTEVDELRLLIDLSRRWTDDTSRIVQKKMQIHQKQLDLNAATTADTSRDLKTVDRSVTKLREEKEAYGGKIANLNKEMTTLNRVMSEKASAVSALFEKSLGSSCGNHCRESSLNVFCFSSYIGQQIGETRP